MGNRSSAWLALAVMAAVGACGGPQPDGFADALRIGFRVTGGTVVARQRR